MAAALAQCLRGLLPKPHRAAELADGGPIARTLQIAQGGVPVAKLEPNGGGGAEVLFLLEGAGEADSASPAVSRALPERRRLAVIARLLVGGGRLPIEAGRSGKADGLLQESGRLGEPALREEPQAPRQAFASLVPGVLVAFRRRLPVFALVIVLGLRPPFLGRGYRAPGIAEEAGIPAPYIEIAELGLVPKVEVLLVHDQGVSRASHRDIVEIDLVDDSRLVFPSNAFVSGEPPPQGGYVARDGRELPEQGRVELQTLRLDDGEYGNVSR